jgi:hypothetical protein
VTDSEGADLPYGRWAQGVWVALFGILKLLSSNCYVYNTNKRRINGAK